MALVLPPVYLLPTGLTPDELGRLGEQISSLTRDIHEARIVLGKISRRERALFELRRLKLPTQEIVTLSPPAPQVSAARRTRDDSPPAKRRRMSTGQDEAEATSLGSASGGVATSSDTIIVARLDWWLESHETGFLLPIEGYVVYRGRKLSTAPSSSSPVSVKSTGSDKVPSSPLTERRVTKLVAGGPVAYHGRYGHRRGASYPPSFPRETTTEHDTPLPPVPAYLHTTYSCQRPTPGNPPNAAFIDELKEVRTLRLLQGDQIGVRAYSSSIAALSAYPYVLHTAIEVERLPGCGAKIAVLYQQWKDSKTLPEIEDAKLNEKLGVLKLFYNIWGVGDTTAREFYSKGWRDLDNIVEYGWDTISRVQQIGVKYYDEFQQKIPRSEVEAIGAIILAHAREIDPGFQMVIVGGYRRGSAGSGDVDVVLSHADAAATLYFIGKILIALEQSKHITHTLTMSTRNSERGQRPLPWKGDGRRAGAGFDTLDKALVVWQDPGGGEQAPHRRVDIIVSPWKTAGCAVLGWSGGTTFERDLRRYCKAELGLKFDSSGIRSRRDGSWVDLEGGGSAPDMLTAEERVFAGLGLPWRRPEERCTG